MSKIERALRKAEEERRKRTPTISGPRKERTEIVMTAEGIASIPDVEGELAHFSEYFRKIVAKLLYSCRNIGTTDIMFTSAASGEGKTTSAINCAISLCQDFNLSVCLVDCDLRNPRVSHYFKSRIGPTIVEHLKGEVEIDSVLQESAVKGLSIAYSRRSGKQSLSLLNTDRLAKLVQELRARFDFVIFDTPPILPVADSAVLSRNVSRVVLVIESGRTRRKQIAQVLEQIDRDRVIGFIMNYKKHRMPETYNYAKNYDYGLHSEGSDQPAVLRKDESS